MQNKLEFKANFSIDEAGKVSGIAWPFGKADNYGDIIEKGAFSEAKPPMPMLAFHDQQQTIGVWDSVEEKADGLYVNGRLLIEDIPRAREIHALLKEKAIQGLSIGFIPEKFKSTNRSGRIISKLKLVEISIVTIGAHSGAKITDVKTAESGKEYLEMENKPENPRPQKDENKVIENKDTVKKMADVVESVEAITKRLDTIEARNNRPDATKIDKQEKSIEVKAFGTYLRHGEGSLSEENRKAMTVGDSAQAGYLAPQQFGDEILKLLREFSPIRQYANVKSMASSKITWPRRKQSTKATWVAEVADRTESDMSFEQVSIEPFEMATYTDISKQLLEDNAYDLEGELQSDLAESFAITEGEAFINGTGAANGQPTGLLVSTQIQAFNAAALDSDSVIDLFYSIPTRHAQNGVFVMNRNTLAEVRKMKDTSGAYMWQQSIKDGQPSTLLGRPVVEAVDMPDPAAGNTPILFGDMSGYRIMDRIDLQILVDPFTKATNGITRFHARRRVGADVTHSDRIKKMMIGGASGGTIQKSKTS